MTSTKFGSVLFTVSILIVFILESAQGDVNLKHKNEPCVCVPFYQCTDDIAGEVVTDGRFLLDQRMEHPTFCNGPFDVCCNIGKIKPKQKKTRDSSVGSTNPQKCGYQEEDVLSWAASMLFQRPDKVFPPTYKCGASIIHKDAVLTAAHCLEEEGYYFIKTGAATRRIYSVTIHPEFEMGSLRHDVAVLSMKKVEDTTDGPMIACIPPVPNVEHNAECIAATFNSEMNQLEKIYVPYVDPVICTERLSTTRLGKYFELHESFVCAGGSEKDTCIGDGGNPLICPIPGQPGRYNQIGIVSWGIGCGKKGIPGVYVNISHVRDWIDGVMKILGKDDQVYKD